MLKYIFLMILMKLWSNICKAKIRMHFYLIHKAEATIWHREGVRIVWKCKTPSESVQLEWTGVNQENKVKTNYSVDLLCKYYFKHTKFWQTLMNLPTNMTLRSPRLLPIISSPNSPLSDVLRKTNSTKKFGLSAPF